MADKAGDPLVQPLANGMTSWQRQLSSTEFLSSLGLSASQHHTTSVLRSQSFNSIPAQSTCSVRGARAFSGRVAAPWRHHKRREEHSRPARNLTGQWRFFPQQHGECDSKLQSHNPRPYTRQYARASTPQPPATDQPPPPQIRSSRSPISLTKPSP